MSMYDTVKAIVRTYLESVKLANVLYGTVTSAEPLEIRLEQRLTLTAEFLILPEHLQEKRIVAGGQEIVVREGLTAGDRVVLVREQGGLNYVLAGRLTA